MAPEPPSVQPGHRFEAEHRFTVSQVRAFASAAGDTNPLHHDEAVARSRGYLGLIASGTHTSALLMGLTAQHYAHLRRVVGLGFCVAFCDAVPADAQVRLVWKVTQATSTPRGTGKVLELEGSMESLEGGSTFVRCTGRLLVELAA